MKKFIDNIFTKGSGALFALGLLAMTFSACSNEDLKIDVPQEQEGEDSEFYEFELPAYMPVTIRMGELTRAEEDQDSFVDVEKEAEVKEFALAPSTDAETYHYVILYKKGSDLMPSNDATPVGILKLDTREIYQEDGNKDVDLTSDMKLAVKRVYGNKEFGEICNNADDVKTEANFKSYLNTLCAFVLINFDRSIVTDNEKNQEDTKSYLKLFKLEHLYRIEVNDYKIKAKDYSGKEKEYFTMSSSMYVDSNVKVPASDIDSNAVYFTQESALAGSPAIKAVVERLAVKYQLQPTYTDNGRYLAISGNATTVPLFKGTSTSGNYEFSTIPVSWSVEVVGFGMNALEPSEKLYKQVDPGKNYFEGWHNSSKKRSYWSEDPHYSIECGKAHYPHQYRRALETDTIRAYQKEGDKGITTSNDLMWLNYFSYNQLKNNLSKTLYSLENTYQDLDDIPFNEKYNRYMAEGLGPYNYYSAGTHFILTCVLHLDNQSARDLYRDEDDVFYDSKADLLTAKLTLLNYRDLIGGSSDIRILNVDWEKGLGFKEASSIDEKEDDEKDDNEKKEDTTNSDLKVIKWGTEAKLHIQDPSSNEYREAEISDLDLVPAMIAGGDGKVMIAPKSDRRDRFSLYYQGQGDTDPKEYPISYNDLVSLFHKTMGAFDFFNKGMMYYCAPVTHTVDQIRPDSWKTVGHVGAVRNNWYKINVKGVRAPGHSVAVADQPIIPMLDTKRDYLTGQMILFRWHEISSGVSQYPNF